MKHRLRWAIAITLLALSAWAWRGDLQPTDVPTPKTQR